MENKGPSRRWNIPSLAEEGWNTPREEIRDLSSWTTMALSWDSCCHTTVFTVSPTLYKYLQKLQLSDSLNGNMRREYNP